MTGLRRAAGLLGWADTAAHWPVIRRIVPERVRDWLCDLMDYSLGEDWTELRRETAECGGRAARAQGGED